MDPDPSAVMTETLAQKAEVFSVVLRHKRPMQRDNPRSCWSLQKAQAGKSILQQETNQQQAHHNSLLKSSCSTPGLWWCLCYSQAFQRKDLFLQLLFLSSIPNAELHLNAPPALVCVRFQSTSRTISLMRLVPNRPAEGCSCSSGESRIARSQF